MCLSFNDKFDFRYSLEFEWKEITSEKRVRKMTHFFDNIADDNSVGICFISLIFCYTTAPPIVPRVKIFGKEFKPLFFECRPTFVDHNLYLGLFLFGCSV